VFCSESHPRSSCRPFETRRLARSKRAALAVKAESNSEAKLKSG
jgi:hypothetical protein